MVFYEWFILIFTFLFLNVPIFISLYKYIFKGMKPPLKIAAGTVYWLLAYIAHELAPFIGVLILLFRVHSREEDKWQLRDINIWAARYTDIAAVAGISLIFKMIINQVNRLYMHILVSYLGIEANPQEIVGEFAKGDTYYKVLLFFLVVILAPFVEEYIFRYYLYDKILLPRMPHAAAAIISTALFTLLHFNISGIPTFFGLGLFCTYIYEKKGYYGAVTTHVVSNLVTAVFLI